MKISDLLKESFIVPRLAGETKEAVINELIDLFEGDERVSDLEATRRAVLDREKIMSTGVGKSFAIPHGKTDAVSDAICAFGKTGAPIDYDALDKQPVRLVFLLVGKDNMVSTHIKLLSRVSRMMTKDDFREKLMEANDAAAIRALFVAEESDH
jgi:fructose-specific phosphotransferase system IIA component